MTSIDAFSSWFRKHWLSTPPAPDAVGDVVLQLAAAWITAGFSAGTKAPSDRAGALAIGMVNFLRPGSVTSPTFFTYWLGGLIDAAGVDVDAEWLVRLTDIVAKRDWATALAMTKGRGAGATPAAGNATALAAARREGQADVKIAVAATLGRF